MILGGNSESILHDNYSLTPEGRQLSLCVPHDAVTDPVYHPDAVRYEWRPEMSQSGRDPGKADQPAG
jgi:hypothetical protein